MGDLQTQLTSILNSLVKVAVVELLRVVQESAVELRLEVSQSKLENKALKFENESNIKRLKSLEAELSTARNRRCNYCVGCISPKTDDEYAAGPITFSEEDDTSWLQQSESAHTVEKFKNTVIESDEMRYPIKKEQHMDILGKNDTTVSSEESIQPCPKVDMVFDKEWSQNLWGDAVAFKEEGDSSGLEDEDTPGPSAIHRQWLTPGESSSADIPHRHERHRTRGRPQRRRGTYLRYTPKQRAKMARMCMEVGAQMAAAVMSEELGRRISPNTVRSMRVSYERAVTSMGVQKVEDLPHLRQQTCVFDEEIALFVLARRRAGAAVSPSTLVAAMRDIVTQRNPEMLAENGGHVVVSVSWARSWLRRFAGDRVDLES